MYIALLAGPAGRVLLGLLAAGLVCFSLWRALQAFADADRHGSRPKAMLQRTVYAGEALLYFGLAVWAVWRSSDGPWGAAAKTSPFTTGPRGSWRSHSVAGSLRSSA